MRHKALSLVFLLCILVPAVHGAGGDGLLKAMILTGQSNHGWQVSSAHYKQILDETKLFKVDVVISPKSGRDMDEFDPRFSDYDVVLLEYYGDDWPRGVQQRFEKYMADGGGLVYVHATNHAFYDWDAFNEIIGIGGWGGRNENVGPYVHYRDGKIYLDNRPGHAGECIDAHEFAVVTREPDHPVMRGLPPVWLHGKDELYSNLRGPAKNMTILATAYSDPKYEAHWGVEKTGTGEHEPMAYTVGYGKGRVFGTPMGHVDRGAKLGVGHWPAIECSGFSTLVQRGAEWAATGKVTQAIPAELPSENETRFR